MKVDIEDVLFWMDAIRNSEDRYRTLESFWKGQVHSKIWLVEVLNNLSLQNNNKVVIHGGWYGVLACLLFNSNTFYQKIVSVDIDPECKEIANTINKRYEMSGRFQAVEEDMCTHQYDADIVINTSSEHITQEQYDKWLQNIPKNAVVVVQSNDYFNHQEHIRCAKNLEDLKDMSNLDIMWEGEMKLQLYTRFMLVGKKI